MADKCEAYFNGKWNEIDIHTALGYPELIKRCVECKGEVRIHKQGGNTPAHAEHKKRYDNCSLSNWFNGVHKVNPVQPNPVNYKINILTAILPEEIVDSKEFSEGKSVSILVNKYERDAKARRECLKIFGYTCVVCDTNLEEKYGPVANKFIHVHHLKPLAKIKKQYKVNPKTDLRPVCPNCHAIMHLRKVPYTIVEVKQFMKGKRK